MGDANIEDYKIGLDGVCPDYTPPNMDEMLESCETPDVAEPIVLWAPPNVVTTEEPEELDVVPVPLPVPVPVETSTVVETNTAWGTSAECIACETPVACHGNLSVDGTKIKDKNGVTVQLRGASQFWTQWSRFYTAGTMNWLAQDWKVGVVRCAMGADGARGGYLNTEAQATHLSKLHTCVLTAIEAGIYVIIDWHEDGAAGLSLKAEAAQFFQVMAETYGHLPNVLFETFNEPLNTYSWLQEIKPYHEEINAVIRAISPNIIIMGSRSWSQEVEEASENPVAGVNLVYALHFYATSHGESIRSKARQAISNGVALFASEWGVCKFSGGGDMEVNWSEVEQWMDLFTEHDISSTYWSMNDKSTEACSALKSTSSSDGNWSPADLSLSGTFIREYIQTNNVVKPEWWTTQHR